VRKPRTSPSTRPRRGDRQILRRGLDGVEVDQSPVGLRRLFGLLGLGADFVARHHLGVAAEQNVGAAAGHVGRDGDGALAPACAMMSASRAWFFAFSTSCGTPSFLRKVREHLDFAIDTVPTSTGWPFSVQLLHSSAAASNFAFSVL
jgi:hypothetical protein